MIAIPKLRIKFGPEGSVRTFQTFPGSEKKIEHSLGEDLSHSAERSKKRGPTNEIDDVQAKKKQKLDSDLSSQCLALLRGLMDHQVGWVFDKPVDPVRLKIPDYFSVISKPMDLGTIKSKLLKNGYGNADEFAADVRLTFANAMAYNPTDNWVHKSAKEIKEVFEVKWESLKKKKVSKLPRTGVTEVSKRQPVEVDCPIQSSPGTSASSGVFSVGLKKPAKGNSEKGSLSSKPVKVQSKKDTLAVMPKALATKSRTKKLDHGLGDNSALKIPAKDLVRTAACRCGLCGRTVCICLKSCSSSGSEASSLTYSQVKNTSGSQASELEPQSNGSVTSRNERNGGVNSQFDKPSNSALLDNELKTAFPALPPVPPEKALRAAIIKAQYADTILKAKHRKVLDQNNKADLIRIQIEKEQMERAQREEKARIEAEMRAAKVAAQMRAQAELKEKRDRQRLELAKMKISYDFEHNNPSKLEKDFFEVSGYFSLARTRLLFEEELGLVLKSDDDHMELEEIGSEICYERMDDLEEGEIL
ncbi:transcription factor GTE12 [Capsella rubella]|nr:transcription factor GTE12 [Capsella rubella]